MSTHPEEMGSVYTLVRISDGVPVAAITALTLETAEQQVQDGLRLVEGYHTTPQVLNADGQWVKGKRPFGELQVMLIRHMREAMDYLRNSPVVMPFGPVSTSDSSVKLLLMAVATGKGQEFLFADGIVREVSKQQILDMVDAVFEHLNLVEQGEAGMTTRIEDATTQEEIQDLVDQLWPDEGDV